MQKKKINKLQINFSTFFWVSADIKLENETDESSSELSDLCLPPNVYHPRHALINALKDWLPEFSRQKTVWGPMSKPQVGLSQPAALIPGVTTCNYLCYKYFIFIKIYV